jgi:hypothetical protein
MAEEVNRTSNDIVAIAERVRQETNNVTYAAIEYQGDNTKGNAKIKVANGAAGQVNNINIQ